MADRSRTGEMQVVFLLDGSVGETQCLACTRLLLNLWNASNFKWSYSLFPSPAKLSRPQLCEPHLGNLERFLCELSAHSSRHKNDHARGQDSLAWGRCLYSALAVAIQDFVWDAPEIKTPVRHKSKQRKSRSKRRDVRSTPHQRNVIFLFSEGPSIETTADGGAAEGRSHQDSPVDQVLPQAMLSQLICKGISVFWVCSEAWRRGGGKRFGPLFRALESTGGGVMPISMFLDPVRESVSEKHQVSHDWS